MSIRIATYNLFEGARDTRPALTEFLAEQQFDAVCLQEANGWQENDFEALNAVAVGAGYDNVVFGDSNTPHNLVTLSKLPIANQRVYHEGFWHSAVEAELDIGGSTLNLCNVHLNPHGEEFRTQEIRRLIGILDTDKPTIIAGDLNCLSTADSYPHDLAEQLHSRGIVKFGKTAIMFSVTTLLRDAGFVDAAEHLGEMEVTVPSAFNKDRDHAYPLRLDYMFVRGGLVEALKNIQVIKSPLTDAISDHYPVVLEL